MHTIWVRLNAVVFFGLTVLLGLSCLAAFSKIGHSYYYKPSKLRTAHRLCPVIIYSKLFWMHELVNLRVIAKSCR